MSDIDDEYQKNTKEQYESLGRFVEAFEAMVNEVRESIITLLERDYRRRRLIEIVLHNQVFSAKPLYEVFRAVVIEIVDDAIKIQKVRKEGKGGSIDRPLFVDALGEPLAFKPEDRDVFLGVMSTIAKEYGSLFETRNGLLHGTWFIGYPSEDPSSSEFLVLKYKTNKEGLSPVALPKNAEELRELTKRCEATREWIAWLRSCLGGPKLIAEWFVKKSGKWFLTRPYGEWTTLPEE
jgi:hypothetical protein